MGLLDIFKSDDDKEIEDETLDLLFNAENQLIKNDFANALDLVDDDEDEECEEEDKEE